MKNGLVCTVALVCFLEISLGLNAEDAAESGITHGDCAQGLVRAMGLQCDLLVTATQADYVNYLQVMGIAPLRGWILDADMTRDDLAVITVQALGLTDEVENKEDAVSYMAVLDERQITATAIKDVIQIHFLRTTSTVGENVLFSPIAILYETNLSPVEGR